MDDAARGAKLDPWRALKLVDTAEFRALLAEVRPDLEVTSLREDLDAVSEREAAPVPVGEAPGDREAVDGGVRVVSGVGRGDARPVQTEA